MFNTLDAERIARSINAVQGSYRAEVIALNHEEHLVGCFEHHNSALCAFADGEVLYDSGHVDFVVIEEWAYSARQWLLSVISAEATAEYEREKRGA